MSHACARDLAKLPAWGALREPIELVERAENAAFANGKRTSFAYLGPIDWDRSGDLTYGRDSSGAR